MINETNIAKHLWAEAVNTTCYIHNRISIRPILEKTPYKLWKNRKPIISYFHPFGCSCFILNTKDYLNKFDSKAQKCLMLGYSERSKGYKVYDTETRIVEESINVKFDDKLGPQKSKQKDSLADIEVQISGSKDSPDKETGSEETIKETSKEPIQKKPSRSSATHHEQMILGKK